MRYVFFTIAFFITATAFSQDIDEYKKLTSAALTNYLNGSYNEAARDYSRAFKVLNGKGLSDDKYNAACSYALANNRDSAFYYLFAIADNNFDDLDWLIVDTDLATLHSDTRWNEIVNKVKINKQKKELSRKKVGSYYYTRMMLFFKVNEKALSGILPEGWAVYNSNYNLVIGFCDVWTSLDSADGLIDESQVKYLVFNGSMMNYSTGEISNVRYLEIINDPTKLITVDDQDTHSKSILKGNIIRNNKIERVDQKDIYEEVWEISTMNGGSIKLLAQFKQDVNINYTGGMDVLYADDPDRRLYYYNDEIQNKILPGEEDALKIFTFDIDIPGWDKIFDGSEELVGVRFIPASKRVVYQYK